MEVHVSTCLCLAYACLTRNLLIQLCMHGMHIALSKQLHAHRCKHADMSEYILHVPLTPASTD